MNALLRFTRWQCVSTLLAVFVLLSITTFPAPAQDATGRIIGVVTDPSGSVIPRAKITATNVATGLSNDAFSGEDGSYQILALPIGSYRVTAESAGFRKTQTNAQDLQINQSLKIDIKMEVGSTTETVQVEANASGVETVNSTLGQVVSGTQIDHAPLNGRNTMDLATLMPGVIPAPNNIVATTAGGTAFSVAGSRTDSVTFLLDGAVNTNLLNNGLVLNPNPDAIEEFKILTSGFAPEFGRNAGAIVSVVVKSGTNQFHGSAYDYIRNDYFNANSFFNNQQGLPKDILKRNQFGAYVGGPARIPKLIGRDKLFFMVAYQGQRLSQLQTNGSANVFTPAELSGDFSKSNASKTGPDPNVVNFLTGNPYFQPNPGLAQQGIIDPTRINTIAKNMIKAGLIPTSSSGVIFPQGSAIGNNDELTEKVDFLATQNDRISVVLGSSRSTTSTPFGTGGTGAVTGFTNFTYTHRYAANLTYSKTLSAHLLNEFRFSANRNNNLQSVPGVTLPTTSALGIGIHPDEPTGPPVLSFSSGFVAGFSVQGPTALIDNTYTWRDDLTWTKGRHGLKMGFNYTPYQNNTAYDFYINGEYYFRGTTGTGFTKNDRSDFLLGLPDEFTQYPKAPSNIRTHNVAGYIQDEWRVRHNLTMTLGVRYEYSSPKIDTQGRSFSFLYGAHSTVFPNAPTGLLFPGDPQAPAGSNFPDRNDWAPRFGFAYDPKGDGKTSIRGGFGVFYDILKGEDNLQFNGQAPFFGATDFSLPALKGPLTSESNAFANPYGAAGQPDPFPSAPPAKNIDFLKAGFLPFGPGGVDFVNPNLRTPYVYQYNLSVQRELMHNTTLDVTYLGSSSHKLTGTYQADPTFLGSPLRIFNGQPGLPTATSWSYVTTFDNVGHAHYNGLAIGLQRRFTDMKYVGGLQYQVSYTYSKSMDNASGFRSRDGSVPFWNRNQFWGRSDFDLTNALSISATWELPFAKAWDSGPKRLTKGWTLFPFVTYRSGDVLDVTSGLSNSVSRPCPSGYGDCTLVRSNLVAPITYYDGTVRQTINGRTGDFYFNPSSFQALTTAFSGTSNYGSLGRNAFRGPDRTNVNVTLAKVTDLKGEFLKLEIRADFFNILNHAEFRDPTTTITSGSFGQISATGIVGDAQPRVIQLAARFRF